MPIDSTFRDRVSALYNPIMGTELVSELLYALVRSVKPRRVMEVGLGYTTPFLLQALSDNIEEHKAQLQLLQTGNSLDPATQILVADYFRQPYQPRHLGIDDMSHEGTTANRVLEVVKELGTDHLLTLRQGDFRGLSHSLRSEFELFDFVWFDCGGLPEYADFLNEYWGMINPDGGILVLHSTLTNMAIRGIVADLKLKQATVAFNQFELVSLLEPHKLTQNSLTMLRMISASQPQIYSVGP